MTASSAPALPTEHAPPAPAEVTHTDGRALRSPRRYHELDLLRFAAAAAVVAFHYCFRAQPTFAPTGFTDPHHVFRYGYLGVDLFFVISGFVILNSAWDKPPSAFVASRIARLYPPFWVACTITAIVLAFEPAGRFDVSFGQWLVNLTMAPTLFDVGQIDGVYWTLLVELKFYLLMLGVCAIGMTANRILAFALGWLALSVWDAIHPLPGPLHALLVPQWSGYFIVGILFALISREGWRVRYAVPLVAAGAWCTYQVIRFAAGQNARYDAEISTGIALTVLAAIFAVFAAIASHRLHIPGAARLAFLGALTYPLYLLHQNIGFVLFQLGSGRLGRWPLLLAVLTTVLVLSWALHVLVERPFTTRFARWLRARLARTRSRSGRPHSGSQVGDQSWSDLDVAPTYGPGRIF